jgi:hypothetical protein
VSVRSTLILSLVAAVGVGAAVVMESAGPAQARAAGSRRAFAGAIPVDDVSTITLRRRGAPEMAFARRTKDLWEQTAPITHPVDAFSMIELIRGAAELETRPLDGAMSRAALGLEDPAAELVLSWGGGEATVRFGRRGLAGRSFVEVVSPEMNDASAGAGPVPLLAIGDLYDRAVEMDPKEWRDRRLFEDVGVDSTRIEIETSGATIVLERRRRSWRMIEPASTRVNEAAMDALFQALGRARSTGFIVDAPDDPALFGLAEPAGSVAVTTLRAHGAGDAVARDVDVQRLVVGARMGAGTEDRYGMMEGRPVVVRIAKAVLDAFFRAPADLVALTATDVVPADVRTITVRSGRGTERAELSLVRTLDGWTSADGGRSANPSAVERLIDLLVNVHAADVVFAPYPREQEVAMITLEGGTGPLDTVRVAREVVTGRWILENGDNVLRLHPATLDLPLLPADFGVAP